MGNVYEILGWREMLLFKEILNLRNMKYFGNISGAVYK